MRAILVAVALLVSTTSARAYTHPCEEVGAIAQRLAIFRDRHTSLEDTLKAIGWITEDAEAAEQEKALARFLWSTHLGTPDWPAAAKIWCLAPVSAAELFR